MNSPTRPFHTANKNLLGEWLVGRVLIQRATPSFGGVTLRYTGGLRLAGLDFYPFYFCAKQ